MVSTAHAHKATSSTIAAPASHVDHDNKQPLYYQPQMIPLTIDQNGKVLAPTSPPYPPYMGNYMEASAMIGASDSTDQQHYVSPPPIPPPLPHQIQPQAVTQTTQHYAYVYPISPPFSVQYYTDYSHPGYQSYPGSPVLHPHQSPPMNPTSPPFSPTYHYQGTNISLSPPTHATYVIPPPHHHHQQCFPPLHISSPVLTGHHHSISPGSPPRHYLPGPYDPRSNHQQPASQQQQQQQQQQHNKRSRPRTQESKDHHHQDLQRQQEEEDMELQEEYERQLQQQQQQQQDHHSHNMYVRGLASSMTDETFLDLCGTFGSIISSKAILDQKSGDCKGYGFAMYEKEEDCLKAIENLNSNGLQASLARVGQQSFSSRLRNLQDENSTNIYISNLPLDMTEQKLEDLFLPCKTISNRILRDPQSGLSRGVGFARLTDRYSAVTIIDKFNGQSISGSSAALQVRFADSPAQKKLKHQTARKRLFKSASPREFQSMAALGSHPPPLPSSYHSFHSTQHLPVTPETMLGFTTSQQSAGDALTDDTGLVADLDQKCKIGNDSVLVSSA
ncbi:hypothetical protein BC941DRAFT_408581 [Chlamydoabsidia padenii]|nr:hypothetical protein BC941DRAFT_408581 [Chlamydoabsidia padenii]